MSPHQFEREMMCSFEAPVENSYYGDLMVEAALEKRICSVPYDPRAKVITAWDLGMKDLTSIWFVQKIGQELHWIDYLQDSGKGLDHYARCLQEKKYLYGHHLFPHDVKVRELGTGRSRFETLLSLDLEPMVVPDHHIADGISGVRTLLPLSWFDKDKCERGIDALRAYHVAQSPVGLTVRESPAHTWASHGADAARTFAMGLHLTTPWGTPGPIKRRIKGIV
jgi:phage terminase large subunit